MYKFCVCVECAKVSQSQSFSLVVEKAGLHSKKCWVILTQFWVKYGQTQLLG